MAPASEGQSSNPPPSTKCQPQPTVTHILKGTTPGVVDPAQPTRLLRHQTHKLSFASFDPLTAIAASGVSDLRRLTIAEELCRPKRIVIETSPSGESFWRFVPNAKRESGCADEGQWPRVIVLCGELAECSLEQWEIYKLDPLYDCLVRAPPNRSVISPSRASKVQHREGRRDEPVSHTKPSDAVPKRSRLASVTPTTSTYNKRPRYDQGTQDTVGTSTQRANSEPNDADQVEPMNVDESPSGSKNQTAVPPRAQSAAPSYSNTRAKLRRDEIIEERRMRREKNARAAEKSRRNGLGPRHGDDDVIMDDGIPRGHPQHSKSVPPESREKRRAPGSSESSDPEHNKTGEVGPKRARYESPESSTRLLNGRRKERAKKKAEDLERRKGNRRHAFEENIFYEEYAVDAHGFGGSESVHHLEHDELHEARQRSSSPPDEQSTQPVDPDSQYADGRATEEINDEDALRRAEIAESIAKMAELDRDRPLWEEQARKREEAAEAEEEALRRKREERRQEKARKAEAERLAQAQKKAMEEKERAEAERREREEAARRQEERRRREFRWSSGIWTTIRALERYKTLSNAFDSARFNTTDPLTFADVPWPVLHSPAFLTVEDISWTAVEQFFDAVKPHMRMQDYKVFVERSHRRFHPDRWRSRGLINSAKGDVERGYLEVAANTVTQALTSLWTDLKGR